MKKLVLGLLLLVSLGGKAQTIDTSIHEYSAAKIAKVLYSHDFPVNTDTLQWIGFTSYTYHSIDSSCTVNYVIKATDGRNVIRNTLIVTATQYRDWDGSDTGLIALIGAFLRVNFL